MTLCHPVRVSKQHIRNGSETDLQWGLTPVPVRGSDPNYLSVGACGVLPVISELESDAEVVIAQQADDILQLVL
jgi:hypothetical protein